MRDSDYINMVCGMLGIDAGQDMEDIGEQTGDELDAIQSLVYAVAQALEVPTDDYQDDTSGLSAALVAEIEALKASKAELLASLKQCMPVLDAHRRISGGEGDVAAMNARAAIVNATGEA